MDSYFNFLLDRINRMNRIFSRFPEETVKTAFACRENLTTIIQKPGGYGTKKQ